MLNSHSVWSDERGVAVLLESAPTTSQILFNSGSGWAPLEAATRSPLSASLSGFLNGPLVTYGASACAIEFITQGMPACSAASSSIASVSIVNAQLAYAAYDDRILRYDGQFWTQLGDPLQGTETVLVQAIWASDSELLVAANAGQVYVIPTDATAKPTTNTLQSGVPVSDYVAAFGFAKNDLWLGSGDGQLVHFDGSTWSTVWAADGDCKAIEGLWGSDGWLYFYTSNVIGVVEMGVPRILKTFTCGGDSTLQGMWGNARDEVFFSLEDLTLSATPCGGARLLWFNGSTFSAL